MKHMQTLTLAACILIAPSQAAAQAGGVPPLHPYDDLFIDCVEALGGTWFSQLCFLIPPAPEGWYDTAK